MVFLHSAIEEALAGTQPEEPNIQIHPSIMNATFIEEDEPDVEDSAESPSSVQPLTPDIVTPLTITPVPSTQPVKSMVVTHSTPAPVTSVQPISSNVPTATPTLSTIPTTPGAPRLPLRGDVGMAVGDRPLFDCYDAADLAFVQHRNPLDTWMTPDRALDYAAVAPITQGPAPQDQIQPSSLQADSSQTVGVMTHIPSTCSPLVTPQSAARESCRHESRRPTSSSRSLTRQHQHAFEIYAAPLSASQQFYRQGAFRWTQRARWGSPAGHLATAL